MTRAFLTSLAALFLASAASAATCPDATCTGDGAPGRASALPELAGDLPERAGPMRSPARPDAAERDPAPVERPSSGRDRSARPSDDGDVAPAKPARRR